MKNTEELPDLIPLDDLIGTLTYKREVGCFTGIPINFMKESASVLVYLNRYKDSLKRKPRRKGER